MFLIAGCLLSQSGVKAAAHTSWVNGFCKSWKDKPLPARCLGTYLPAWRMQPALTSLWSVRLVPLVQGLKSPPCLLEVMVWMISAPRSMDSHLCPLGEACACVHVEVGQPLCPSEDYCLGW